MANNNRTLALAGADWTSRVAASTPNPQAIRVAAQQYAQLRASEVSRIELLRKLGLVK